MPNCSSICAYLNAFSDTCWSLLLAMVNDCIWVSDNASRSRLTMLVPWTSIWDTGMLSGTSAREISYENWKSEVMGVARVFFLGLNY